MILRVEDRDELLSQLTEEQREYLSNELVRSRRTAFANIMAAQKGYHIPEDAPPNEIEALLDEWVYEGYIDAGKVSPDLRCECNRPLRYQHRVKHKTTGQVMKFGIEHLKEHLGIDSSVVAAIKKGFEAIDYELDELLLKWQVGWQPDPEWLQLDDIPNDIRTHLELGLPLLDRQMRRLQNRLAQRVVPKQEVVFTIETRDKPKEIAFDLFDWDEESDKEWDEDRQFYFDLDDYLKEPIRNYLEGGTHSVRIICELLISKHDAPPHRFLTGKPRIYLGVCHYIESLKGSTITFAASEDRHYEKA